MRGRSVRGAALFAVLTLSPQGAAYAQTFDQAWRTEGLIGLYGEGSGAADNGFLFIWRYSRFVSEHFRIGFQAQFRDDDPSRGRSQAFGLGFSARFLPIFPYDVGGIRLPEMLHHMYIPVGALVEGIELSDRFHVGPRIYGGVGLAGRGALALQIEGQASYGFDGRFLGVMAGVGPGLLGGDHRLTMSTSSLRALTPTYILSEGFRPYGARYEAAVDARVVETVRGTLSIDILEFMTNRNWSTGAIGVLGGVSAPLRGGFHDAARLALVVDGGVWIFLEGGNGAAPYPLVMPGFELSATALGATPVVGVHWLIADGPAGALTGVRIVYGIGIDL